MAVDTINTQPFLFRDMSAGQVRKYSIDPFLVPENSVSHSINVNFDTIIGAAVVRLGTTLIGVQVAANKTPLGLVEYVNSGQTTNNLIAAYSGASNATLYFYNGTSWAASTGSVTLTNTSKFRFAMLGNQMFEVNGTEKMQSSSDGGATWGVVNSIDSAGTIKPSLIIRAKNRILASGDSSQNLSRVFYSSVVDPAATPGTVTWLNATQSVTSITRSGTTATVTLTAHTYSTNNFITIAGAVQTAYNGIFKITVVDANTFTYTVTGSPATPATGTITAASFLNFIDINPDDGADVTGFANTSALTLVFKDKHTYRLDVITKTVDTDEVFPFGAPSQEAIVNCQGLVYFYTGQDIRVTSGADYPEQISRPIQEWIDQVPQANWAAVAAGTDGWNVWWSLGAVTVPATGDDSTAYSNVVIKYSTRDKTWSVHTYGTNFQRFCQYTTSGNGRKMIGADTGGNVQTIDKGATDNGTAISFDLQTQEIDFGNRAHNSKIADRIVVFTRFGLDSSFQIKEEDNDFQALSRINLNNRVAVGTDVSKEGTFLTFRWTGIVNQKSPVFQGFYCPEVQDLGIIKQP